MDSKTRHLLSPEATKLVALSFKLHPPNFFAGTKKEDGALEIRLGIFRMCSFVYFYLKE